MSDEPRSVIRPEIEPFSDAWYEEWYYLISLGGPVEARKLLADFEDEIRRDERTRT